MKKIHFKALALGIISLPIFAQAQTEEKKEVREVVISTDGKGSTEKTTVIIDGDKITINGKPIEEFKKDNITVRERRIKDVKAYTFTTRSDAGNRINFVADANIPFLGVSTEKTDKGLLITNITENSGAEKAGLKEDDIIIKIEKTDIKSPDELTKEIRSHKKGDKIEVTYIRDGKTATTTATLGEWKNSGMSLGSGQAFNLNNENFSFTVPPVPNAPNMMLWGQDAKYQRLGLSVQDMEEGKGAKIITIMDESAAEKSGLQEDDIITSVDGKEVKNADDVAAATKGWKDKSVIKFNVLRNGKTESIDLKVPKKLKVANL